MKVTGLEEKLLMLANRPVNSPDSHRFLGRLHAELERRKTLRQRVIVSTSAFLLTVVTTVGLFQNLRLKEEPNYPAGYDMSYSLDVFDEDFPELEWDVDGTFVLEAMDYLIRATDLDGTDWEIVKNLDELGVIDMSETIQWEG